MQYDDSTGFRQPHRGTERADSHVAVDATAPATSTSRVGRRDGKTIHVVWVTYANETVFAVEPSGSAYGA